MCGDAAPIARRVALCGGYGLKGQHARTRGEKVRGCCPDSPSRGLVRGLRAQGAARGAKRVAKCGDAAPIARRVALCGGYGLKGQHAGTRGEKTTPARPRSVVMCVDGGAGGAGQQTVTSGRCCRPSSVVMCGGVRAGAAARLTSTTKETSRLRSHRVGVRGIVRGGWGEHSERKAAYIVTREVGRGSSTEPKGSCVFFGYGATI